jgi:hypothetical protein
MIQHSCLPSTFFLPSARMPRVIHRDFMVIDGDFVVISWHSVVALLWNMDLPFRNGDVP